MHRGFVTRQVSRSRAAFPPVLLRVLNALRVSTNVFRLNRNPEVKRGDVTPTRATEGRATKSAKSHKNQSLRRSEFLCIPVLIGANRSWGIPCAARRFRAIAVRMSRRTEREKPGRSLAPFESHPTAITDVISRCTRRCFISQETFASSRETVRLRGQPTTTKPN